MALMKCPECDKEISDKAAVCPNCGAPVTVKQENTVIDAITGKNLFCGKPATKKEKEAGGCCAGCLFIFVLFFVVIPVIMDSSSSEPSRKSARPFTENGSSNSTKSVTTCNNVSNVKMSQLAPDDAVIRDANHLYDIASNSKWSLEGKLSKFKDMESRLKGIASFSTPMNKEIISSLTCKISADCRQIEKDVSKEKEAKKKAQADLKKKFTHLLKKFRLEEDKLEHGKYYTHVNFPKYVDSRTVIYPYVAASTDDKYLPALRTRIEYTGTDWLFVQKVSIYINNNKIIEKDYGFFRWNRDNGNGKVWEWLDILDEDISKAFVFVWATKESVDVRFAGRSSKKDFKIGPNDKQAIKDTIDLYSFIKDHPELLK